MNTPELTYFDLADIQMELKCSIQQRSETVRKLRREIPDYDPSLWMRINQRNSRLVVKLNRMLAR